MTCKSLALEVFFLYWPVLSDEQILNDQQMSNWLGMVCTSPDYVEKKM